MLTALDDARSLAAGEGRYERDSAFEPLLAPLVAAHVALEEVAFTCYVGSLAARPNPRVGWPLLGIAVAHAIAPLITADNVWNAVQTLPDLALYLPPELVDSIALRPTHERISRRIALLRGERPFLAVERAASQPWDATALALHFEHSDLPTRQTDAERLLAETSDADHSRRLLFQAVAASYAAEPAEIASSALRLLEPDIPAWYWCTLAAHLGACTRSELPWLMSNGRIPSPWAEHYDRLVMAPTGVNPLALPAAAHPFGHELVELIAQMPPADRRTFAREVLNSIVDRWSIDTTLDPVAVPSIPDASAPVVPMSRAPEVAIPSTSTDLSPALQVDVTVRGAAEEAPVSATKSFVKGADHQVVLWLDDIDPTNDGLISTVTLTHDDDTAARVVAPRRDTPGGMRPVPFDLFVRPDERYVVASVLVSRGGSIVHRAVLIGPTGATPDEIREGRIELRIR